MGWVRSWGGLAFTTLLVACGSDSSAMGWDPQDTDGSPGTGASSDSASDSEPSTGGTVAGSTTDNPTDPGSDDGSTGEPPDDPGDPFAPVPEPEPLDGAMAAGLSVTLAGILDAGALGAATVGALVVDLETEQVVFERSPDTVLVPASNTKMFTTAAMLDILGPDTRIETQVFAGAGPDGGGVVSGDLQLLGRHDVSWSTDFYGGAREPLDRIAELLYEDGVRTVSGDVIARGEFMYGGASLGTYNAAAYRATAATRFSAALQAAGISVQGGTGTSPDFDPPAGTRALLTWRSPPLSSMAVPINVRSHNEFADVWLRHLGWAVEGESTYVAGGAAVVDWMPSLPTDNAGAAWNDGSGLSHGNRTSPRNIVDLLRAMERSAHADRWMRSMSIAGVRGTLAGRMGGASTAGRFWGKTGTLPSIGVVAVSGMLFHRDDGRRYAVSLLFNGVPNVSAARGVQDQFITALAANHHGVARLPAPELVSTRAATSDVVEMEWTAVRGADGYAVWFSADGEHWDAAQARRVDGTEYRAGELSFSGDVFVRVTAFTEDAGATHSKASDVYGSATDVGPASVLVVDGHERWQAQRVGENPRALGHNFVVRYAEALASTFDTASAEAVGDERVVLSDYDVVLWMLGEESDTHLSFDDLEQDVLRSYIVAGGSVMVSGSEFAYDLGALGTPEDTAFLADVLHVGYTGDDAATWWLHDGQGALQGAPVLGFSTRDAIVVDFPDQLNPVVGGETVLSYFGGAGGTAAVAWSETGSTFALGVPFESIEGVEDRTWLLEQVLASLQ
ncbi:MAG: D-alanyl-D-alanine carboxypeptidase [Nannocystaceae bacterium]|nr:D-alanyl-D-alanine carboxypeptidase [Nannocystaceae bacterium]